MKNRSRLDRMFFIFGSAVLAAGLLHTGIAYLFEVVRQQAKPFSTSFPPEVELLLFVPYALALCLLCAVWLCLRERQRGARGLGLAVRICGVLALLTAFAGLLTVLIVAIASGGSIDTMTVCCILIPFFAAIALMLLILSICLLCKRHRTAEGSRMEKESARGENEENT